jgi:AcrR family transcriptional regulator
MPTQTFWNLTPEKRKALIATAVEEFAANDYSGASISRIVKRAGISKGSIYQYFNDKHELFRYLVELSNRKRLEYVQSQAPPELEADFWALLRWQVGASTRAALAYPLLTRLFYRAISANVPFRDELLDDMRSLGLEHWKQFVRHGIAEGAVASDIDLELAAVMVQAVFSELGIYVTTRLGLADAPLHELDVTQFQSPEVERIFDQAVLLLRRGIAARA